MSSTTKSILYEVFRTYYDKALNARDNKSYTEARSLFEHAAEALFKLAKLDDGEFKLARIEHADRIMDYAKTLPKEDEAAQTVSVQDKKNSGISAASGGESEESSKFPPIASPPPVTFNDIAGLHDVKEAINTRIIKPRDYPEVYKALKKKPGGGVLMYGPPGTGKTMVAKAIANKVGAAFFPVKCSEIVSKWFGEAEKNVRELFENARRHNVAIIFFDEFESLGAKRGGDSSVMDRLVPELLNQIDGFQGSYNTLLILAATNRPWDIDSAFLRPGRFAELLYIPLPDAEARKLLIEKSFEGVPMEPGIDFAELSGKMEGYNGADVVEFCDRSKDPAADRCINNNCDLSGLMVMKSDIDAVAEWFTSSVQPKDIEEFNKFNARKRSTIDAELEFSCVSRRLSSNCPCRQR